MYFHVGHIFSDDSYYSYLSHTLLNGEFASNYLGYPVFPLRIAFFGLTALSMNLFGINESATIILPMVFSLLSLHLSYKITKIITNSESTAIITSILMIFFPTDIVFASIAFPDLINVFFINFGIYFLLKSHYQQKIQLAFIGGISLFLSMQFKETAYYVLILLIIILIYLMIKEKKLNTRLAIGIFFILGNYLIEGLTYLLLHNDFFYRLTITSINYGYSFYDFFPHTAQKLSATSYFRNLFDQIFLINVKSIFLRRFYLFLPMVSVIQTFFSIKKKEYKLLLYWFWGTAILLIGFTTSFTEYKPLDLARSWYIYPLLMPALILSAIFITRFSKSIRFVLIIIYIAGSFTMCIQYEKYFDTENLDLLKSFIRSNPSRMIYTDHFTKYSVDLIRGYEINNSRRILGTEFDLAKINKGDWVLFNKKHIDELVLQKYQFPEFGLLNTNEFKKVASFNDFIFYEKLP